MEEKLYHNKFASLYDDFQKGVKHDIEFCVNYFKNFKGKILEIGAGTGRITIPLLRQCLDVMAIDIAPKMIAILKEKARKENIAPKTVCADMRRFKLRDKFEAIIVTFRAFQHMYSVNDQLHALEAIKRHLKPNGVLIFDVYNPSLKYIQHGNWQWKKDKNKKPTKIGKEVKFDYRNRYDMAKQIMYQEYRFCYPDGKNEIASLQMRFFFRFEIEHLLRIANFRIKNLYGDFKKNKFNNASTEMIWVAEPIKNNSEFL